MQPNCPAPRPMQRYVREEVLLRMLRTKVKRPTRTVRLPRPQGNQIFLVKPIPGLRIGLTIFWLFHLSGFFLDLDVFRNIFIFSTVRLEAGKNGSNSG